MAVLLNFPRLIDLYKAEKNTNVMVFTLLNDKYQLIVNSNKDLEIHKNLEPSIQQRHLKSGLLLPKEINWPVMSSENFSQKKWTYALVNIKGYKHNNYRGGDAIILNLMCNYLQQAIEKYYLKYKSKTNIMRSLKVLNELCPILAESKYALL